MARMNPLTRKEDFINEMILSAHNNTKGFDVGTISSGEFTFHDLTGFILLKGLSKEFKEYYESNNSEIFVDFHSVFVSEVLKKDLPFDKLDKDYKEGEM